MPAPRGRRGEEYLLERRLLRRKSTGEVIDPGFKQFSYPTRWHYDVLRGLDYFRSTGERPDDRAGEAIELVRSKEQPDGTWLLENTHKGAVHFTMDAGEGQPSRWNTLARPACAALVRPLTPGKRGRRAARSLPQPSAVRSTELLEAGLK